MKNVKLTIQYDGTGFSGWQRQPNGRTVQEEIEKALFTLLKREVKINGSGRTDAGVHAMGQVANFKEDFTIPIDRIPVALNGILPEDISITMAEEMDMNFHARYSAKGKKYLYKIYNSETRNPLLRNYSYWNSDDLDLQKIRQAVKFFVGEYDFKGFMSSGSTVKDTIRSIYSMDVSVDQNMIIIETSGNGFLYNMVRIMVGTLVEVGRHKIMPHDIPRIIQDGKRNGAGPTAPPQGLYLAKVYY